MFTGIIQAVGHIESIEARDEDVRLRIATRALELDGAHDGDSIAVNGCCLTAVELAPAAFSADVSRETLSCTTLGDLAPGSPVNLEKSLTPSTPLGGHLVSGHVDGIAELMERRPDARSVRLSYRAPADLARYIARKGSICIDGVSLTVNEVDGPSFGVNIVPHTLTATTFGQHQPGQRVNLEVDQIARYLERLLAEREPKG
jgi:riboflavin synthase